MLLCYFENYYNFVINFYGRRFSDVIYIPVSIVLHKKVCVSPLTISLHVFPSKCYKVAYERHDSINYELSTATASDLVVQLFKRFFFQQHPFFLSHICLLSLLIKINILLISYKILIYIYIYMI